MRTLGILLAALLMMRQQEPFTLRIDVDLVTLDVGVTDAIGRPVRDLTRDDFQIYEDGKLQEIRSFAPVETPYNILMVFDCSGSTEPNWPFLIQAMQRFTGSLRPQDAFAAAQFGDGFEMLLPWSTQTGKNLEVRINTRDRSCEGTDFYGAIGNSLAQLRATKGRKGAIMLTDGGHGKIPYKNGRATAIGELVRSNRMVDSIEDNDFQKTLKSLKSSGAIFYFVAVNTDLNPNGKLSGQANTYDPDAIFNMQQRRARIEQLAEGSGGRVVYPKNPDDVIPLYEQIGRELGTSYGLGYTPSNPVKDGSYRKIEVRPRDPRLQIRQSRESYEAR